MRLASQIALAIAVVASLSGGVFLLAKSSGGRGIEIVLPDATAESRQDLKVYVTGAVVSRGVYEVADGDRLEDVLNAAGGRTADADLSAINLATRVKDEDHWHFPRIGDQTASVKVGAADGQGKIDLNSAAPELLQTLPGIGEVKALAIVQHRGAHGPFASIEAVVDVQGIGASTLTAIRDLVEVR